MSHVTKPEASLSARATRIYFAPSDVDAAAESAREVPVETPVAFSYGSVPHAVMMATPADLEDFLYGFSLTEGIIEDSSQIRSVEIRWSEGSVAIDAVVASERMATHLARRRSLTGRTGCGVCGIAEVSELSRASALARDSAPPIAPAAIGRALGALEGEQQLNTRTRAVHAAAFATETGELEIVREDVGRHNALDKLIGALMRAHQSPAAGFSIITSRCSFEMVEKAASAGIRTLVAVSAPTSLAIERATALGIRLIAVARPDFGLAFTDGAPNPQN